MDYRTIDNGMVAERRPELASVREDREVARQRREDAQIEARWAVITGRDARYWDTSEYDGMQAERMLAAVKLAASLIAVPDASRWKVIADALYSEAEVFAEFVAEGM